jgi:hypothetical protein
VTKIRTGLGMAAAAVAVALFAYGAQGQQKAPDKTAPKAAAQAKCNTIKQQAGCGERADCSWVAESKDAKGKVKAKAYCRAKPKAVPKKEAPKKEAPKKT